MADNSNDWLARFSAQLGQAQGNALFPFLGNALYSPQASAFMQGLGNMQNQGIADYTARSRGTNYAQMPGGSNMAYDTASWKPTYNKPLDFFGSQPRGTNTVYKPYGAGTMNQDGLDSVKNAANVRSAGAAFVDGLDSSSTADPYMTLLQSLLKQSQGGGGFGGALASIRNERKGVNQRYKENQGDIKTMFGNLTTMRRGDIAGVSSLAEAGRATSAEQTAAQATQTRDAEATRLAAANQARAELGLGDIAAASATGDLATQAAEAGLANQGSLAQIGRTASEVNQSIAEQAINDEIARYSTEQDQSLSALGRSRDAALSDISGREQQLLAQQAQAAAQAQQASTQLQLQIAGLVNEYQAGKLDANTPTGVMAKWVSDYAGNDPVAGQAAATTSAAFWNWIQQSDNLLGKDGKPLDALGAVNAFAKYDPENAAALQQIPELNFLLTGIWNTALTKPKAQ